MRFSALSPSAWALGAALLLAILGLLHLLRVRLRRVDVDTLLFFRLAGAVRQPRVLPGSPARLWAFVLASAAVLAAWTAFGDPRGSAEAPSRIVLVEPASGLERQARLEAAAQLVRQGLGPRGAVLVADRSCAVLRAADEPADALWLRAAALPAQASAAGVAAALRAAADRLRPGDELVHVGTAPPELQLPQPLRLAARGATAVLELLSVRWCSEPDASGAAALYLVADVSHRAGGRVVVRAGTQELNAVVLPAATEPTPLTFGPVPRGAVNLELQLVESGGPTRTVAVPVPRSMPVRVHVAADVPAEAVRALRAALPLDPYLDLVAERDAAEVLVAGTEPQDPRPCLVLTPGSGGGPRFALATAACPLSLSLRDRTRRDAPALAAIPDATTWVEDVSQREPLVAATHAGGRLRVHAVAWLLEPATHGDVPQLLLGALRLLAGRPAEVLALAGAPVALPAAWADAEAHDAGDLHVLPVDGVYRFAAGPAADSVLTSTAGPVRIHALAVVGAERAPVAASPVELASFGGARQLAPWLLAVLLLALLCDALWFHRGRLP